MKALKDVELFNVKFNIKMEEPADDQLFYLLLIEENLIDIDSPYYFHEVINLKNSKDVGFEFYSLFKYKDLVE